MTLESIHELYSAVTEANMSPLRILDGQNILKGNPVAKNIFIAITGDGIIQSGGFDMYLHEIKLGHITNAHVKEAFQEIGFTSGLEILNKAKRSANLNSLDMKYYGLGEEFEKLITDYAQQEWNNPEFVAYCDSISFKRGQ